MSRFRVAAAGVAVAVLALVATPSPASAHDELLSSTPSDGQALAASPETVSLTFSADVLEIGAVIVIADAEGTDWTASEPTFEGGVVTAEVQPDMPAAGYELRWRVVSGDGHPIAGIIPFTIGDGEPLVRAAADAAEPAPAESQTAQEGGVPRVVLIGGGGAILAIAAYAVVRYLTRRRTTSAGDDAPPASGTL